MKSYVTRVEMRPKHSSAKLTGKQQTEAWILLLHIPAFCPPNSNIFAYIIPNENGMLLYFVITSTHILVHKSLNG